MENEEKPKIIVEDKMDIMNDKDVMNQVSESLLRGKIKENATRVSNAMTSLDLMRIQKSKSFIETMANGDFSPSDLMAMFKKTFKVAEGRQDSKNMLLTIRLIMDFMLEPKMDSDKMNKILQIVNIQNNSNDADFMKVFDKVMKNGSIRNTEGKADRGNGGVEDIPEGKAPE